MLQSPGPDVGRIVGDLARLDELGNRGVAAAGGPELDLQRMKHGSPPLRIRRLVHQQDALNEKGGTRQRQVVFGNSRDPESDDQNEVS
jgi:hypothetical protein